MNSCHVLLGGSHVEEVLEFSSSELVVSILSNERLLLLRSLDIPEIVVWNSFQDFLLSGALQTAVIGRLKISREVVLAILEYS
jgi:hypothetical protein